MTKKILTTLILTIFCLGLVAACGYNNHRDCNILEKTYVEGKITYSDDELAGKADITIVCNHEGTDYTRTTTSLNNGFLKGTYFVEFPQSQCVDGDLVTVTATKDGLSGSNDATVIDSISRRCLDIDVALIDVVLVPEFGTFMLLLTALGAGGIFFVVRRK